MASTRVGAEKRWRRRAALLAALSGSLLVDPRPATLAQGAPTAPSYVVVSSGLTAAQAGALGQALHIPVDGQIAGGAYQYVDPARFLAVPTIPVPPIPGSERDEDGAPVTSEGIDLAGVLNLRPPSSLGALIFAKLALGAAGIPLPGSTPHVSNSFFDGFAPSGLRWLHQPIATHVSFTFQTPDGTPLEGPGAQAEFAFDTQRRATLVLVATRELARGPDVPIISEAEALAQCAASAPTGAHVAVHLVHHAPPLSLGVAEILPAYRCEGDLGSGQSQGKIKPHYITATPPGGPHGPPIVHVSAVTSGPAVNAQADVTGGTPPYRYAWGSANTPLPPVLDSPFISYDVTSRDSEASLEIVNATVIDANGLVSSANASVAIAQVPSLPVPGPEPASRTVGIEYQSWSAKLPGSALTAAAFQIGAAAAVPSVGVKFVEADMMSWETDFRADSITGGQDHDWVDNVDLVYYSGHGFPGGFTFTTQRDFPWISSQGLRLGDRDLDWLALDTCRVLNNDDGLVVNRVKALFTGLHSVLGFDTVADDTSDLGGIFTDYLFGTATNPNSHSFGAHLTLVQAWALAAIISNGSGRAWAAMGPYGPMGISDMDDRFWGFGATGPDIRGANIKGYWRLSGPT